jgi:hypothetical protein
MSVFVSFCVVFSGGEDAILKMRCQGFEGLFYSKNMADI